MNSVSFDIVDLLEYSSESEFVFATNIFIGKEPANTKVMIIPYWVTLFDTSSQSPANTLDGESYNYESIQIRVTAADYQKGYEKCTAIKTLLHNKKPGFINGTFYTLVTLQNGPRILDYDEKNRVRVIMNFTVQRTDNTNIILMNLGDIEFHNTKADFPDEGEANILYVDKEIPAQYLYDAALPDPWVLFGNGGGFPEAPIDDNQYARKNAAWSEVEVSGGGESTTVEITISVADWAANKATKAVSGVTADNTVFTAPKEDRANTDSYTTADILTTAQGVGTLTFSAVETPTTDIIINVVILS
jgi:hypothetical protein